MQFEIQGLAMLVYLWHHSHFDFIDFIDGFIKSEFVCHHYHEHCCITNVVSIITATVTRVLHVVSISAYFPDAHSAQEVISSQQAEPPPPISLEDLQGEARNVASRVLSRPQSGMVFMEDVKSAIAMWADRLTNLLGPPKQGTVQIIVLIFFINL